VGDEGKAVGSVLPTALLSVPLNSKRTIESSKSHVAQCDWNRP